MPDKQTPAMNLAAPCGLYCGTCRHYLARANDRLADKKLKHGCRGCRVQDKRCSWIKKGCETVRKKQVDFCHECGRFPCADLRALNDRHVRDDQISPIDNLMRISEIGPERWLDEQSEQWRCPACGGEVCVMDHECYTCGRTIERTP